MCVSKIKIRIKYLNFNNQEEYITLFPGCLRPIKNIIYLYAFNSAAFEIQRFPIERIIEVTQLTQINNSVNYTNSITFKVTGNLAINYVLKEGETIKEEGDGYKIIYNIKESKDELLKRLLRYYEFCEVLYPKQARLDMKNMIDEIYQNYME